MSNTSDNALDVYVGQPGLQVSYNGGVLYISGSLVTVAAGTIAVTKNATNYIYLLFSNSTVTANTSGFPAASFPMATVVCDNDRPTTVVDVRADFVTPSSDQGDFVADAFTSSTASPASAGVLRLAKTDAIKWRNNANGGDIAISKNTADAIVIGDVAPTGTFTWTGSSTADVMDFSGHTRASGKKYIRMGFYDNPVLFNGTGLFQAYSLANTATGAGYLFFFTMRGNGAEQLIGIQMTVESESVLALAPSSVIGLDWLVGLTQTYSVLATAGADTTAGMFGARFKVYGVGGSTVASGARIASIWLDTQMEGPNVSSGALIYSIYAGNGNAQVTSFARLEGTNNGSWKYLFSLSDSAVSVGPLAAAGAAKDCQSNTQIYNFVVDLNGTPGYIPVLAAA